MCHQISCVGNGQVQVGSVTDITVVVLFPCRFRSHVALALSCLTYFAICSLDLIPRCTRGTEIICLALSGEWRVASGSNTATKISLVCWYNENRIHTGRDYAQGFPRLSALQVMESWVGAQE